MIVSNETKAEIIELFIANEVSIKSLIQLYGIHHKAVSKIIYTYYGYGEQNQYGLKSKV